MKPSRPTRRLQELALRRQREGAERARVLYSLIASCKLHVNPSDYLRDILVRVADHPTRDVLAFSPKGWKQAPKDLDAAKLATAPAPCRTRLDSGRVGLTGRLRAHFAHRPSP